MTTHPYYADLLDDVKMESDLQLPLLNLTSKSKLLQESPMVSPFGQLTVATKSAVTRGQTYQLMYVDDLGAYKTRTLISQ